jgi:hypothetical protein
MAPAAADRVNSLPPRVSTREKANSITSIFKVVLYLNSVIVVGKNKTKKKTRLSVLTPNKAFFDPRALDTLDSDERERKRDGQKFMSLVRLINITIPAVSLFLEERAVQQTTQTKI